MRAVLAFAALALGSLRVPAQARPVKQAPVPQTQSKDTTATARVAQEIAQRRAAGDQHLPDADNFSFGEPVYLSRIIAAAQAVEGVDAVAAERFQRLVSPSATSLDDGVIPIGDLEIAQLANDPSFPERGRLTLSAGGGK